MCPLPSFKQEQLVASLAASPPLPSASPTPTPGYSGADPRPQISSSVKHSSQLIKSLPAIWETLVRSLDWEDLLEMGTTTHCSILAGRIPWTL